MATSKTGYLLHPYSCVAYTQYQPFISHILLQISDVFRPVTKFTSRHGWVVGVTDFASFRGRQRETDQRCNDGVVCTWASCKKTTTTTTTTDHVSDPTALSSPERPSSFWRSGLVPPADTAAPSGTHSSRCWLDTGALPWPAGGSTLFTASNDWCFEQPVNLAYSNDNSQYCCILHHPFPSPSGSTTEKTQRIHFVSLLTDFLNRFTSDGAAHDTLTKRHTRLLTHQIFKLHIQVLADGELGVRYGLVKVRVQIVEHLNNDSDTGQSCHEIRTWQRHDRREQSRIDFRLLCNQTKMCFVLLLMMLDQI